MADFMNEKFDILGEEEMSDVLTVAEAAALLRVDVRLVYDGCKAGTIPHRKVGKRAGIRLSREALLEWLKGSGT